MITAFLLLSGVLVVENKSIVIILVYFTVLEKPCSSTLILSVLGGSGGVTTSFYSKNARNILQFFLTAIRVNHSPLQM